MARRKTPKNETSDEKNKRQLKEIVANRSSRREKVSWNRKMNNIVKLLSQLTPIEEQIIELQSQKIPLFDAIQELRQIMVLECVHPYEYLEIKENHVICKFCNRKIKVAVNG